MLGLGVRGTPLNSYKFIDLDYAIAAGLLASGRLFRTVSTEKGFRVLLLSVLYFFHIGGGKGGVTIQTYVNPLI